MIALANTGREPVRMMVCVTRKSGARAPYSADLAPGESRDIWVDTQKSADEVASISRPVIRPLRANMPGEDICALGRK